MYGKAADIISSGIAGWNTATLTELVTALNLMQTYGDVLHPYDNFNAIACMPIENIPFDQGDNSLITFDVPSMQYRRVRHLLGFSAP